MGAVGAVASLLIRDERSLRPPISTSDETDEGGSAMIGVVIGGDETDEEEESLDLTDSGWCEDPEARLENRLDACWRVRRVPRISSQFVLHKLKGNTKPISAFSPIPSLATTTHKNG